MKTEDNIIIPVGGVVNLFTASGLTIGTATRLTMISDLPIRIYVDAAMPQPGDGFITLDSSGESVPFKDTIEGCWIECPYGAEVNFSENFTDDSSSGGSSGVQSISGTLVDNTDPKNPLIKKGAYFSCYSEALIGITTDSVNPSFIGPLTLEQSNDISMVDSANGTIRNDSGRTISMVGTINYNPNKGAAGVITLNIVSERSSDNGVTWTGNLRSRRSVEISNSTESFGTKLSIIKDLLPWQYLRFRAWISDSTLNFESSSELALGEVYVTPSVVWELSEV